MIAKTNPVNDLPEVLDALTKTIKGSGAWCKGGTDKSTAHYYISRNPKSQMAISLCAAKALPIASLVVVVPEIKCLVCESFHTAREEVKLRHDKTITKIEIAKYVQQEIFNP
jgi:hypothetical protein